MTKEKIGTTIMVVSLIAGVTFMAELYRHVAKAATTEKKTDKSKPESGVKIEGCTVHRLSDEKTGETFLVQCPAKAQAKSKSKKSK